MAPITYVATPALKPTSQLYLPSDDGTTLSTHTTTYPLVLLAPAQQMDPQQLGAYAQRLASHGIVVALYGLSVDSDQVAYRAAGLGLLNYLLNNMEPVLANHLDATKVGLAGYDLGAEMSVAMATQLPTLRGLFLLDPQVVGALMNPIDGLQQMAMVQLANAQPVLILGEQVSKNPMMGPACTQPATNYEQFYNSSATSTIALNFPNAAHADFVDTYPVNTCGGGTMAPVDTQRLASKYMVAYFQWSLLGRTAAKTYLTGASFTTDAQQYMLTLVQK
jgi:dienelactone hydrolase